MKPLHASSTHDADARMITAWAALHLDHLEDASQTRADRTETARLWIQRVMALQAMPADPAKVVPTLPAPAAPAR